MNPLSPTALRTHRKQRRLTQRALAGASGVPEKIIQRLETGTYRHDPRIGTALRLAGALGVGVEVLINQGETE